MRRQPTLLILDGALVTLRPGDHDGRSRLR